MELMVIATIIQTALIILILAALLIGGYFLKVNKNVCRLIHKVRSLGSVESTAIVLNIEETGLLMNRQPIMKLQVQVTPDKGRNFVVEIKEVLAEFGMSDIKPGSKVLVRYVPGEGRGVELVREA